MNVTEFIERCVGKWFSQRTSHALPPQALEAGTANLWIDLLDADDETARDRCKALSVNPEALCCAFRTRWEGTVGTSSAPSTGSTLTLFVAQGDPNQGKFWRWADESETALSGTYRLGDDDALTLAVDDEAFVTEERLWFVSDNLRERTSLVRHPDGSSYASFCSEIRMGLK